MTPLLPAVLALLGLFAALQPGVREGRQGVRLLEGEDSEAAAAAFVAGLAHDGVPRDVAARLWHGLGVARVRQREHAPADSAFSEALARADAPAQRAHYAADAGTAALLSGDAARAVDLLRRALVLDPGHAGARRNYEIARRRLDAQDSGPTPEARQIKARADSLVAARQYGAALDVMERGLEQDATVATYADFIGRLSGVAQIEGALAPDTARAAPPER